MKLPYLPYNDWTDTRITLHLIIQIIGKIRLKSTPRKNHWWYITLYVSSRGFTTHDIPLPDGINSFEILINIHQKSVQIQKSTGGFTEFKLKDGVTVAEFYHFIMETLNGWDMTPEFIEKPLDMGIETPFKDINNYHHYNWDAIHRFWQMMLWTDGVFKEFSGRFYGKTCPVHIYWHHLDLAVTRFSGKLAPPIDPGARILEKDSYSHEVISFGFWAGDDNTPEPAYYAYVAPSPDLLDLEPLSPEKAFWIDANGSPMAILKYSDIVTSREPRQALLSFLESAYQAGAKLAGWDIDGLTVPPLDQL